MAVQTDPQITNDLAALFAVHVTKWLGEDTFVPLDVRFGFAEEVQIHGWAREPFQVGDRVVMESSPHNAATGEGVLRRTMVVENERIWVVFVEWYGEVSVFESYLRHAPHAQSGVSQR